MGFNFVEVTRQHKARGTKSTIGNQVGVAFYRLKRNGQIAVAIGKDYMANSGLNWTPGQQLKLLIDAAQGAVMLKPVSEGGFLLGQQKTKTGSSHFILSAKFDVGETISRVKAETLIEDGCLILSGLRFPGAAAPPVLAAGPTEVKTVGAADAPSQEELDAAFEAKLEKATAKASKNRKGQLAAV